MPVGTLKTKFFVNITHESLFLVKSCKCNKPWQSLVQNPFWMSQKETLHLYNITQEGGEAWVFPLLLGDLVE